MMKNFTLLFALLSFSLGFSQQQQYLLDFEPGDPDAVQGNWTTFENPAPGLEIVANPDPNGTNTDGASQVMRLTMAQSSACYAGAINLHGTLGTWEFDGAISSNNTLSMDVNKSIIGANIGIKMANVSDGTVFEITDNQGQVSSVNTWQTLTWDISQAASSGENMNVDQIVIFIDFTCAAADQAHAGDVTLLVDNISWGANKLTSPGEPTCSDGIQNGDEEGIDCGGSSCAACPNSPDMAAAAPDIDESDVLSVYSDSYPNNTVTNFNLNAFAGSTIITQVDIEGNSNNAIRIQNLDFYGAQWDAVDLTSFTFVNFNYYAVATTGFNFYLIDETANIPGGNPAEPRYSILESGGDKDLVLGEWQTVTIPLQHFLDEDSGTFTYDLNDIFQYKFDGNGEFYIDNIFFSTESLGIEDLRLEGVSIYPNPTNSNWSVKSSNALINSVEVFNILGKRVLNVQPTTRDFSIDGANLAKGVYIARIESAQGTRTVKLIRE